MDLTLIWKTVLIGVVEGLTEFLPVSSTGHIILAEEVLHFQGPPGKVFEIVIQLGAILAVCVLYRAKILGTVTGVMRREPLALRFAAAVIVAFLPAAVVGVAAHKYIKAVLDQSDGRGGRADRGRHRHPDHRALCAAAAHQVGRRHRPQDGAVHRRLPVPGHDPGRVAIRRHHHGRAGFSRGPCEQRPNSRSSSPSRP